MYLEDEKVTPCIDATLACYRACLGLRSTRRETISEALGELLAECAEVSRETAHQLIAGTTELAVQLVRCAEVSDRCADMGDPISGMAECAAVCRWCANACRDLGAREAKAH